MRVSDEILAELEIYADHSGIQVLVTEDLEAIDLSVAPWLDNIVVDEHCRLAVPDLSD